MNQHEVSEERESLWALILAPAIWVLYFVATYVAAAVWCGEASRNGTLGFMGLGIAAATVVTLVAIAMAGWRGWSRLRALNADNYTAPTHDKDSPEDRGRFLAFATLLLAGLSAMATVYVAVSVVLVRTCS
jgi:hypothetical protein